MYFIYRLVTQKKAKEGPVRNMCYEPEVMITPVIPKCCPDKEREFWVSPHFV